MTTTGVQSTTIPTLTQPESSGSRTSSGGGSGEVTREFRRLLVRIGVAPKAEEELIDQRYRIEKLLGRGAMGVVYLANDGRLGRKVALKLVRGSSGLDPELLRARLEREARALAKVDHQNVVKIYDVGTHGAETYLTMQYVPGPQLRKWQRQEGRGEAEILDAYLQAARGLAAAHGEGVAHRDFKPDNAIVGEDGIVRVVDFGIAAAIRHYELGTTVDPGYETQDDEYDASDGTLEPLTRTGTILGTMPYMSPEQLAGQVADDRSDQYAYCVALWEALTGDRPYTGRSTREYLTAIGDPPAGAAKLSRRLAAILARGLNRRASRRYPDMEALIAALEQVRGRRRKRWISGVLGAALLSSGLAGWGLSQLNQIELEQCESFTGELDRVWNDERREGLRALASQADAGEPRARGAVDYAIATLDELADQWRRSGEALCRDGIAPAFDSRGRACHRRWLGRLDRSVALMLSSGAEIGLSRAPDLLAALVPPGGDYCALEPELGAGLTMDREVAQTAAAAREAALFGDLEGARALANQARARAEELEPVAASVHRAEALEALGEVHARAGELDEALEVLALAQTQALAARHQEALLAALTWRAKVSGAIGSPEQGGLAAVYVEFGEGLGTALELSAEDPRRGELALAAGLAARARGEYEEAIEELLVAKSIFTRAARPTLVAKALVDIGLNHRRLGRDDQARAVYHEAIELLEDTGVPPNYATLLSAHFNAGVLGMLSRDPDGFEHLEWVTRHHPNTVTRFRAYAYTLTLADLTDERERARAWAERAAQAYAEQPELPVDLAVELEMQIGAVLAENDDPAGERLMSAAEARAASLDPESQLHVKRAWIESLIERGRVDEARARFDDLERFLAEHDEQLWPREQVDRRREQWFGSPTSRDETQE